MPTRLTVEVLPTASPIELTSSAASAAFWNPLSRGHTTTDFELQTKVFVALHAASSVPPRRRPLPLYRLRCRHPKIATAPAVSHAVGLALERAAAAWILTQSFVALHAASSVLPRCPPLPLYALLPLYHLRCRRPKIAMAPAVFHAVGPAFERVAAARILTQSLTKVELTLASASAGKLSPGPLTVSPRDSLCLLESEPWPRSLSLSLSLSLKNPSVAWKIPSNVSTAPDA